MSLQIADAVCEVFDDDMTVAVLHLKTREWFFLNSSAGHVWALLRKEIPLTQAYESVADFYGIETGRLEEDMAKIIRTLVTGRVLVEVDKNAD